MMGNIGKECPASNSGIGRLTPASAAGLSIMRAQRAVRSGPVGCKRMLGGGRDGTGRYGLGGS